MRSKRIDENSSMMGAGHKTFVIVFDTGDQVITGLKSIAGEQHLAASHFTAIRRIQRCSAGLLQLGEEGL